MEPITVSLDELPSEATQNFRPEIGLPSPEEVRVEAIKQGIDVSQSWRPKPVRFPDRGILVKWGEDVTIAEGQCLWYLQKHLQEAVPVPEVFGWTQEGNMTFLYLELVAGDPLSERWEGLQDEEKTAVCEQLHSMIHAWRRIQPPPEAPHPLSHIAGQPLRDIHFSDAGAYPAGPFSTLSDFHDAFARLAIRPRSPHYNTLQPRVAIEGLAGLTDDVDVVFTHADLDLSNILVSRSEEGSTRIVAIIDWHQSGWYPEPWEGCKARAVAFPSSEWKTRYVDRVLGPAKKEYAWAWEYVSMSTI